MSAVPTIAELLTPLDRRVLEEVPAEPEPGGRTAAIATRVIRRRGRRSAPVPDELEEVAQILRGLEATGFVRQAGGWWRRVPT